MEPMQTMSLESFLTHRRQRRDHQSYCDSETAVEAMVVYEQMKITGQTSACRSKETVVL